MANKAVLQTKLTPPHPQRHTLARPRLSALLREALDYPVTIVQASTGYGKTTALSHLCQPGVPLYWYSASEGDVDPQQFLSHLTAAFHINLAGPGDIPIALAPEKYAQVLQGSVDALLNTLNGVLTQPSFLVIDDYHFAASETINALMDRLLAFLPRELHAIIATRYPPEWEHLPSWRVHGLVLEVRRDALAFTREETEALFRDQYGLALSPADLDLLTHKTEGWPIALQLVWQGMRSHPQADISTLLSLDTFQPPAESSLDTLFTYLAQDVLAQQPRPVQDFLMQTTILRELDPITCHAVTSIDCQAMLSYLRDRDLFLISLGNDHYRYHHLFYDFLYARALAENPTAVRERHRSAAEFYVALQEWDEAIYHLLAAKEFGRAATVVEQVGEEFLRHGRLETLAGWLDSLPSDIMGASPLLLFYQGELARLHSRFDDALNRYAEAEHLWRQAKDTTGLSRALRGQALVYLDTLRTPQAEKLLQQALQLIEGANDLDSQAGVLELLAENKLNMGRIVEAERLRLQARALRENVPDEDTISVRVKLRTGQLDQAREILETWAAQESGQLHPPRGPRETLLLLSLIYSVQGRADEAFRSASESLALGARLQSPYVSVVAQMRLGHAYQILGEPREAIRRYEQAIAQGDQLAIVRVRAEARWGMTRAHGLLADLASAQTDAAEGVAIARDAGDSWIAAQVQLALGASQVLAKNEREAIKILVESLAGFHACGDTSSCAAAWLWLALASWRLNERERALNYLEEALSIAQPRRFDYLFTSRTLLGCQDPCILVPLLLEARRCSKYSPYVGQLLAAMRLENLERHPGYQLRLQTLGSFRVWRGDDEVSKSEWQRKKARQLLELLVTMRGRWLGREEIFELLLPSEPPESAARDFKVALNALNRVLEPERATDDAPAFVLREETSYKLSAGADIWIDTDEFARLVARADALPAGSSLALDLYRRALALYQDDYLRVEAPYEDWAIAERERLQTCYLRAADRLAIGLLERGELDECETWCHRILARDHCWEHAYRLLMRASARRGNYAAVRRVFDECCRVLQQDLGVSPSPTTVKTLQQALNGHASAIH